MGSTLFLSYWDPLDSVYARLDTEEVIRAGSIDFEDYLSDAATALGRRRLGNDTDGPISNGGAVNRVHSEKVVGKEGGFRAASARTDFEEGGEMCEWVWGDESPGQGGGERINGFFGSGNVGGSLGTEVGI